VGPVSPPFPHDERQGMQEPLLGEKNAPAGQTHSLSELAPIAPHDVSRSCLPGSQLEVHLEQFGKPGPKVPAGHGEK
jgi:hypothetical protein